MNNKNILQNHRGFISNGVEKIILIAVVTLLSIAPHALAQSGFVPLAPIPGLTDAQSATSVVNSQNLADFFNNLYKYLIGLAAVLAVIEIIWGGLEYSTQDSVSKKGAGKERIQQAILGLVLILSPVLVFSIINPSILNLSLNLPPLNTQSVTPTQGSNTAPVSPPTSAGAGNTIDCVPTNDCRGAETQCLQQGFNGSASPSVECINSAGSIDTQQSPSLDTSRNCPSGETKKIQCVVTGI